MRPMFLEYPYDMETFDTDAQFMFGKELLIAPVVKKNAKTKNLYLPEIIQTPTNATHMIACCGEERNACFSNPKALIIWFKQPRLT